ncbi:hypothetical protein KWH77_02475 [Enterobacter sichuanensis]|uniref:hypothetical protein n=1 Tax=Enterobacter sichuanensis TaxID=2071710 RepID=UPI0021D14C2C|nr:hypothetical protein [Enterobacter sichuanensis]MCU6425068.1 hypothetical protein [Enterobacter sichuanensis]
MQDSTFLVVLIIIPLILGVVVGLVIRGKEMSLLAARFAVAEKSSTLANARVQELEAELEHARESSSRFQGECEELGETILIKQKRIDALEESTEINSDGETWKEIALHHWLQLCQQRAWQAAETWGHLALRALLSKTIDWDAMFEDADVDDPAIIEIKRFSEVYTHYNSYRSDCEMWMRRVDEHIEKYGGYRDMKNCINPAISRASRVSSLVEELQKKAWDL